jgi:hypothetical protein
VPGGGKPPGWNDASQGSVSQSPRSGPRTVTVLPIPDGVQFGACPPQSPQPMRRSGNSSARTGSSWSGPRTEPVATAAAHGRARA